MPSPTSCTGIIDVSLGAAIFSQFSSYFSLSSGFVPTLSKTVLRYPEDIAQREYAEKQGNQVVDFISYYRNVTQFSWERNRSSVSRQGVPLTYNSSTMNIQTIGRAIPLDLTYEIIFWHHDKDVLNVLVENYFFWVHQNPTLTIDLLNFPTSIYVNMTENAMDDISTLKNMYQVGKYFCFKNSMKLESWIPQIDESGSAIWQIIANIWYKQGGVVSNLKLGQIEIPS